MDEKLKHISSYTSKLLRRKFGRGPESCHAWAGDGFLVMYIRGFICPMEEILLEQGHHDMVMMARDAVITGLLEELKGVIDVTFELEAEGFYHDWNYVNNSGMIAALLPAELPKTSNEEVTALPDFRSFEQEIARCSALTQKIPEQIHTFRLHSKLLIVIREGVLVPIEKALIAKGYEQELRVTKDELEKTCFHNNGKFDEILKQKVTEIFIDWSFRDDKSLMCFVLN